MSTTAISARKKQVIEFLSSEEFRKWEVRISKKALSDSGTHYAEVDAEEKEIIVNPEKPLSQFVPTIVHEILHVLFPRSREKTIVRWEHEIGGMLAPSEWTTILNLVFTNSTVLWDE